ncbi:MAG: hypothetical protein KatS3mg124_0535 [Porticoccaceae bacterium]|nr:MAG: hypothetical protein KatS3mg124_0535 [Porticoccaceae bacterium]
MDADTLLQRFTSRLEAALGPELATLGEEFRVQLRAAARAALERLEVVDRELFDAHVAVLRRARAQLRDLERRVEALEAALAEKGVEEPPDP